VIPFCPRIHPFSHFFDNRASLRTYASSCQRICPRNGQYWGRAIAEAVSRWLPTAVARVRARHWQVKFVVDKVASGQVVSEYFGFPYQNRSFHQLLHPHNHPQADTQRPCDELITRPRSPTDSPRSSNRNETESFMRAAKAQNWAVEP
jgi:hypothetical protein